MRDFDSIEEYKAHKMEKHRQMVMKQNVPYSVKVEIMDSNGNMIEFYKESEEDERAIHEKDIESLKHRLAAIQEMGRDSD